MCTTTFLDLPLADAVVGAGLEVDVALLLTALVCPLTRASGTSSGGFILVCPTHQNHLVHPLRNTTVSYVRTDGPPSSQQSTAVHHHCFLNNERFRRATQYLKTPQVKYEKYIICMHYSVCTLLQYEKHLRTTKPFQAEPCGNDFGPGVIFYRKGKIITT